MSKANYSNAVLVAALFCSFVLLHSTVRAQGGGGAGAGVGYRTYNSPQPYASTNLASSDFIVVTGSARLSVKPQALRLVVSIVSDSETANECSETIKTRIANTRRGLSELDIADRDIVEDFIVVKRNYKWKLEEFKDTRYIKEIRDGFQMQSNLHILCDDEAMALKAIDKSFAAGINEVVSFDYWHNDLDQFKQQAMKEALKAAREKADILLSVFDDRPRVLNVNNTIQISTPASQYQTIKPPKEDPNHPSYQYPNWNGFNKWFAPRPTTTFYSSNSTYADTSPKMPPMNPEISVHSTVTLTFESPTKKDQLELQKLEIENASGKIRNQETEQSK